MHRDSGFLFIALGALMGIGVIYNASYFKALLFEPIASTWDLLSKAFIILFILLIFYFIIIGIKKLKRT